MEKGCSLKKLSVIAAVTLAILAVAVSIPAQAQAPSFSNPSVIPGSQANLHGPYVSSVRYLIFTSDAANFLGILSGQIQIMDFPPSSFSNIQQALSTPYLNVTSGTGSGEEFIYFNMYSPKDPGYYLPFRQAIAHLVNYTYIQSVVLNGIQGVATPNLLLPSAFGDFSSTNIVTYPYSLQLANESLARDPQIAWNPNDNQPSGTGFACTGGKGVWEYATSPGSGIPNGTAFTPIFYTRNDHPTWLIESQQIWKDAAKIGLCLKLIPVTGFGSIYPIVFEQYSDKWAMYFGGVGFSSPLNPITDFYYAYTKDPGWANPFLNTVHFYNATIEQLLHEEYAANNLTLAASLSRQVDYMLSQQIPILNMWWDSTIIPSLNNYGGTYWSGYVNVPSFSTWTFATGIWTLLNVHQVNPATGQPIVGGTFTVGQHEAPDDFNPFQAESVYDFDIINAIYDSPMVASPANPSITGLIPWMLTGYPIVKTGVTLTTPHGYKIVNGQTITLNFMNNITFQDNVKMTAADYNFSLWVTNLNGATYNATTHTCSAPCWVRYVNYTSADYTGTLPTLVDSVVNNQTSVTVYINDTSYTSYLLAVTLPVFPEHLWSQVSYSAFDNDINPITNSVGGTLLETGTGPFYFGTYVSSQYTLLYRNPGYFRTNIYAWTLPSVSVGQPLSLNLNLTQQGTPIPSNSVVRAYLVRPSSGVMVSPVATLTQSGTSWSGSLSTAGLAPGFYEVIVNATYTTNGITHTALQFWGVTLTSSVTSTTTTTSTTSTSG
ncbi:hypothetical protein B9Q13_00430, partial [Candidatus Marsarchaeota G2 archaeon ECH_B_SAG-G16]